ncbi:MAG: hypothetical protein JJ992_05920, partial [Planctomycetes bacterium]|nr:hypothetical protein [Planctomycetota bacterium]
MLAKVVVLIGVSFVCTSSDPRSNESVRSSYVKSEPTRFGGLGGGLYVKGGQLQLLGNTITGNWTTEGYGFWPSEGGGLRLESG